NNAAAEQDQIQLFEGLVENVAACAAGLIPHIEGGLKWEDDEGEQIIVRVWSSAFVPVSLNQIRCLSNIQLWLAKLSQGLTAELDVLEQRPPEEHLKVSSAVHLVKVLFIYMDLATRGVQVLSNQAVHETGLKQFQYGKEHSQNKHTIALQEIQVKLQAAQLENRASEIRSWEHEALKLIRPFENRVVELLKYEQQNKERDEEQRRNQERLDEVERCLRELEQDPDGVRVDSSRATNIQEDVKADLQFLARAASKLENRALEARIKNIEQSVEAIHEICQNSLTSLLKANKENKDALAVAEQRIMTKVTESVNRSFEAQLNEINANIARIDKKADQNKTDLNEFKRTQVPDILVQQREAQKAQNMVTYVTQQLSRESQRADANVKALCENLAKVLAKKKNK
ncbi:hypothetical protein DOTSEDRAFT_20775, partial [Dothistroma septosporum NZE10]